MDLSEVPSDLARRISGVRAKRPKTVLDHILAHGSINTDELKETYGYNHPPRAIRDVREHGIPLKMTRVVGPDGRSIASYTLDLEAKGVEGRSGRRTFPKSFKDALVAAYGERCALCGAAFPPRALQIDHRVPYEVGGDTEGDLAVNDFMLVCGSCNRAKSWSCEHCENWLALKDAHTCETCMWASPDDYEHIAMEQRRRLTIVWSGDDTALYDAAAEAVSAQGRTLEEVLRDGLRDLVD